jgi:hypothetical protein
MASSGSVSPVSFDVADFKALEQRVVALERKVGVAPVTVTPVPGVQPQPVPVPPVAPPKYAGPNRRVHAGVSPTGQERRH